MPTTPAFAEVLLPTTLSFQSEFGAEFSTTIVMLGEGGEQRNSHWRECRFRGDLQYAARTLLELQRLIAFAHARRGEAQGFRFRWLLDREAVQQFVGIGDGATSVYQLLKIYDSGDQADQYIHRIRKPVGIGYPIGSVVDTVILYQDGVPMVGGYTVNYTTGRVTLSTPLGLGVTLTWSGLYDHAVRFASPSLLTSLQAVLTRLLEDTPESPGPPQYFVLQDQSAVPWYYWINTAGGLAVLDTPPDAPFVLAPLVSGAPPSWIGLSDERPIQWYMYPGDFGVPVVADTPPPLGEGVNFNVPLPFPLAGPERRGENGRTLYTLAANSAGGLYIYYTIPPDAPGFDGLGMTESLPIIGLKT